MTVPRDLDGYSAAALRGSQGDPMYHDRFGDWRCDPCELWVCAKTAAQSASCRYCGTPLKPCRISDGPQLEQESAA